MKRFSEQFKKQSEQITLSLSEKDTLRERLSAYMDYHPLPITMKKQAGTTTLLREPFILIRFPLQYLRQVALLGVCIVVIGIPVLAERAVPGDVLYSMKVRVNEEVRASLTSSGYEKVAWETQRLERRIAEARVLAKEGRLTPEVEADVIAAVTEHQAVTTAQIETLRTTDADAAALAQLTLASVLDIQAASLKTDTTANTVRGKSTVAIASVLDEAQAKTSLQATEVSYERMVATLEQETTRSRELLANIQEYVDESAYRDIERRLSDTERKVQAATDLYNRDSHTGMVALKGAWRDVQVLITFMTDIDVRTALALDTYVPVVPTPDEDRVVAMTAYTDAAAALTRLTASVATVSDSGVQEKITLTLPTITTLLDTASTSLLNDNVAEAKQAAIEAQEYTRSLLLLAGLVPDAPTTATIPSSVVDDEATTTATSTPPDDSTVAPETTDDISVDDDV